MLRDNYEFEVWSSADGEYRRELKSCGINVLVIEDGRTILDNDVMLRRFERYTAFLHRNGMVLYMICVEEDENIHRRITMQIHNLKTQHLPAIAQEIYNGEIIINASDYQFLCLSSNSFRCKGDFIRFYKIASVVS